jgi:ornithine cyclodeaminase/alanine dehydrogenase-like protein (mu-crystallin family)
MAVSQLRLIRAGDLRRALPMQEAVEAVKAAFVEYSTGRATVPLRTRLDLPEKEAATLVMPAHLAQSHALAVKVVSVFPANPAAGLPTIHALVVVLDPDTGRPTALIEGASLTALRTGAASGAATDLMARPDARILAVFGSGVQARTQAEAVCAVRPIEAIRIFSLDPEGARRMVDDLAFLRLPQGISVATSAADAVRGADIVCTATTSSTPVFDDPDIGPGTHINAIGAFTPQMAEVPAETVRRARIAVDSRAGALAEAGDLLQPLRTGMISERDIAVEIGEIAAGISPGRGDPSEITLFKSVGLAVQDAAAAAAALRHAEAEGLGRMIEL